MYEPQPYHQWQPRGSPQQGPAVSLIILACLAWTIFVPLPGPFDDFVVWAIGAWMATKGK